FFVSIRRRDTIFARDWSSDVCSSDLTIGNQNLVPVQSTNVDVKWELFPTDGELVSFGVFYKNMKDPIARSETGNNVMTYFNVGRSEERLEGEVVCVLCG